MLYIEKSEEPKFMVEFKKRNPNKGYESKEFSRFRAPLNFALRKEQKGLCAYCCSRISEGKSHNEHIEPQNPGDHASHRTLDYNNIVASCNNPKTCGNKKKNVYDVERFVSPLDSHCEEVFTYYRDGVMEGNQYTIDLLNLNEYGLKSARKAICEGLKNLDKESIAMIYLNEETEEYQPFLNMIKWYYNTL